MGGKPKSEVLKTCVRCNGSKRVQTTGGRCWGCNYENSTCSDCYRVTGSEDCRHCDKTGYEPRNVTCVTCDGKGVKPDDKDFDVAKCKHCYEGKRTEYWGAATGKLEWYHHVRRRQWP